MTTRTLHFNADMLQQFATASRDANPLHLSDEYARSTAFSQQVVFGILGVLASLPQLDLPAGQSIQQINADFLSPMYLHVDYRTEREISENIHTLRVLDGDNVLMNVSVVTSDTPLPAFHRPPDGDRYRTHAAEQSMGDFVKGATYEGGYDPDWDALLGLMAYLHIDAQQVHPLQIAILMASSYLIGMEVPGEAALYSKLNMSFDLATLASAQPLAYSISLNRVDTRFDMLRMQASFHNGSEQPAAQARLNAFVRRKTPAPTLAQLAQHLPGSDAMAGQVALIIGASRGLGASLALALASQGATVYASYHKSAESAEALAANVAEASGSIQFVQGNGRDLAWCQQIEADIRAKHGKLDILICNASPAPQGFRMDASSIERINRYFQLGFELVSVPLATFLPLLQESAGLQVTISSIWVSLEEAPTEWAHYMSLKRAIEGLTEGASQQYENVQFLIVRPPRLQTDMTNTVIGWNDTLSPLEYAAQVVKSMQGRLSYNQLTII